MKLVLITKTPIIEKIFTLVCKKLSLELIVKTNVEVKENVDFIVVDEDFINDDFNTLRTYSKKLAAVSSEELPFDKARDFVIERPFLPTSLEKLLLEQIEFIKEDEQEEKEETKVYNINEEEVAINYVDSLADDVAYDIEEESDESIITIASLNNGGVLDNNELGKISDILHDDDVQNKVNIDENDWKDINEIIDDALTEVKDYEFDLEGSEDERVRVLLNNYNISELKLFLMKLDQSVVEKLSSGQDVDVTLCLKVNK